MYFSGSTSTRVQLEEGLPNGTQFETNSLRGESIVCFGGENWWYHHPHSKNHILKRLAKQNQVLFVNSITMGLPSISNPDFLPKVRRKLKTYLYWLRKVPEGLWVMTPINVPFYGSRLGRFMNWLLLLLQLRLVMLILNLRKPIIWVAIPTAADIVDALDPKLVLYQVSDKYDANEDSTLSPVVIRELDRRLRARAAVVLYSGRKLFEESDVKHRFFLEQAVDFDHFAIPAESTAPEVVGIPHPVLGYFGAMDHVMDQELIKEVADRRPEWHWLFIGAKSNLVQINAPNVHFVSAKPYAEMPRYIRHIDVCVQPWRGSESRWTSYGSSIKVREYMATGKPVIISPLYEYMQTPGIVFFNNADEFIEAVEYVLANDTAAARELRQSVVRDGTWDVRARQVGALISSLLAADNEKRLSVSRGHCKSRNMSNQTQPSD